MLDNATIPLYNEIVLIKFGGQIMRLLRNKQIHRFISFYIGKTNFRTINCLIQRSLVQHTGSLIKFAWKPNKRQFPGNENFQTNRLVSQILIFKSYPFFDFCRYVYCAAVLL